MIFELINDIPEDGLVSGEKCYGYLVGTDPESDVSIMVKFLKNDKHDNIIIYLEKDGVNVLDDSDAGNDILDFSEYVYANQVTI